MDALKDIERRVGSATDELNGRLGLHTAPQTPANGPVRTVTGRVVSADSPVDVEQRQEGSFFSKSDAGARIIVGIAAAFVLYRFFPFHFQYALLGLVICLFQSFAGELMFARIGRMRPGSLVGASRCINCRRRRLLRWFLLFSCCEAVPLAIVYFVILYVFN